MPLPVTTSTACPGPQVAPCAAGRDVVAPVGGGAVVRLRDAKVATETGVPENPKFRGGTKALRTAPLVYSLALP